MKKNILLAEFKHETNSFARGCTTYEDFKAKVLLLGNDIYPCLKESTKEIVGFFDYLKDKKDINLIPVVAADAMPGPPVDDDFYEYVTNLILDACRNNKLDGLLLSLHGAMVSEKYRDGEGRLLERIRQIIPKSVPVFITLDLHANMTQKMVDNCDAIFMFHEYPHVDTRERGLEAARLMYQTLNGNIKPVMQYRLIPCLCPPMTTLYGPGKVLKDIVSSLCHNEKVLSSSLGFGFFYSDLEGMGMSLVVITDNDEPLANELADTAAKAIWEGRATYKVDYPDLKKALELAAFETKAPTVIADIADNIGCGASGDNTILLRELIQHNPPDTVFAALYDPETVSQACKAGVGENINVRMGGKEYSGLYGDPIECTAYVKSITDGVFRNVGPVYGGLLNHIGTTVVLVVGNIEIIVISKKFQAYDIGIYYANGIDPAVRRLLVVKSTVHYKGSYGKIACQMFDINNKGLSSTDPAQFTFRYYKPQ